MAELLYRVFSVSNSATAFPDSTWGPAQSFWCSATWCH